MASRERTRKLKRAAVADALRAAGLDPEKAAALIQELAQRNYVVIPQPPYGIRNEPRAYRPPTMPRSWM